ncbi:MAG: alpha/beta fold hydrolase, partial [Candidatus Nanopelagicales bacterium]
MTPPAVGEGHLAELRALGARSVLVDGPDGRIHALDYGGELPPLVVLPGITSPAITWDFVVSELRDLVRPVVLDLRGRGLSEPGAAYGAADHAADAAAVIAGLGLHRPLLLGHSLGARAAAALLADRNPGARGSVLVDPPLSSARRGPYPTPREAFLEQLHEGYAGTTGDAVRRFYPAWPRQELLLRARWVATCDEAAVTASYDAMVDEDFLDWWPRVPAPTAMVRGGVSPVVT